MRQTARKIQRINYVPSLFSEEGYRNEIKGLIEDPLPKNSSESYYIQVADFISFFLYLYIIKQKGIDSWHNRLSWLNLNNVVDIIERITPILNTEASREEKYGIVLYPK